MTIYLDVLWLVNLYVNYFLLRGTARLLRTPLHTKRLLLSSVLGSLAATVILLPERYSLLLLLLKPLLAAVLVRIAFGKSSVRLLLIRTGIFFGVNFLFAGVMLLLWTLLRPQILYIAHGVVYLDISAVLLAAGTIVAYLLLWLWDIFHRRHESTSAVCALELRLEKKICKLTALPDTGHLLTVPEEDIPVLICEWEAVRPLISVADRPFFTGELLLPPNANSTLRIRCIPYHGVGGDGLLRAFLVDTAAVGEYSAPAYVAVVRQPLSEGNYQAIIPAHLLHPAKEELPCSGT